MHSWALHVTSIEQIVAFAPVYRESYGGNFLTRMFGSYAGTSKVTMCCEHRPLFICFIQVQWPVKLQFAYEVTCGMNYLHTKTPKVIHGDLKIQNVLIGDGFKAKVDGNTFMQSELNTIAFVLYFLYFYIAYD